MDEKIFKQYYRGMIETEFKEDFFLVKTIRRTLNSFIKKPKIEKLHAIYNKIYITRNLFDYEFLYDELTTKMDTNQANWLMSSIIAEFFDINYPRHEMPAEWETLINEFKNIKI